SNVCRAPQLAGRIHSDVGTDNRRQRWGRRQFARRHDEPARRLPAEKRRTIQRPCDGDGALRCGAASGRRQAPARHNYRRRPDVSDRTLHRKPALQARAGRLQMGSNAMLIHLVARRAAVAFLLVVLAAGKASAQFEFVGSWAPLGSEDVQNDSVPVDYLGLALTDEARARALSYDESQKSMIERQCAGWGEAYMVLGPFGLRVTSQTDPATNRVVSYTILPWEDWNGMVIWMDDRARPSEHALHTQAGFTVGRWEGGALAARTTHLNAGFIRKTGVPLSDQAT